jgi:hypothetical protein
MQKQIDRFSDQLSITEERIYPMVTEYDWEEDVEIYRYDQEEIISLPDFDIQFNLLIEEKGTYTAADNCHPEEFAMLSREIEIQGLKVYDTAYGQYLKLDRRQFTDIILEVKTLITI